MTGALAFAEVTDDAEYGDAPRCPACGKFIGANVWLPPYKVQFVEGTMSSAPGDLVGGPGIGPDNFLASTVLQNRARTVEVRYRSARC